MIEINSRVTVFDKTLHGRQENLIDGTVVGINSSVATVQVDHEDIPRDFPLASLVASEAAYGAERTSRFDNSVIDAIRR